MMLLTADGSIGSSCVGNFSSTCRFNFYHGTPVSPSAEQSENYSLHCKAIMTLRVFFFFFFFSISLWFQVERCQAFSVGVSFYDNRLHCPYRHHHLQPPLQNHFADVMTHNCLLDLPVRSFISSCICTRMEGKMSS